MKKQCLLLCAVFGLAISITACSNNTIVVNSSSSSISNNSSNIESSSSSKSSSKPIPCEEHVFKDAVRVPSIVQKGADLKVCEKCGFTKESNYTYDLNEFTFKDKTFMYDGQEKELLIEGMIPYGTAVKYENNKLTNIGSIEATAKIYDGEQLLDAKTATLTIVDNIGLPNIRLTTSTGKDPDYHDKTNYTTMSVSIDNCDEKYLVANAPGGIRARGNSTNYDVVSKHPWRLKFDSKINLLGLNDGQKFKSWVLLASYFDQSYLRDAFAFSIGNGLFNYSNNYCSDFKHVNFYMNGDYRGVYVLAEQQQANKGRLGLAEPNEGVTAEKVGYLVEIDIRGGDDDPYFTCGPKSTRSSMGTWSGGRFINGVRVVSSTYAIKSDTFSDEQNKYIEKYVANAMDALINAVTGEKLQIIDENNNLVDSPYNNQYDTLNSFMDLDSLFKTCILHELMKSYDVGFGSFYLFVDFTSSSNHKRLTFGAPWDFDLSCGNKQSGNVTKTNNEFIKSGFGEANFNPWLYLISQTDFYDELFSKYYTVFINSGVFDATMQYLKYVTTAFVSDFANDTTRWKNGSGKNWMQTRQYNSQKSASDYLTNWLNNRKNYMDGIYLKSL